MGECHMTSNRAKLEIPKPAVKHAKTQVGSSEILGPENNLQPPLVKWDRVACGFLHGPQCTLHAVSRLRHFCGRIAEQLKHALCTIGLAVD